MSYQDTQKARLAEPPRHNVRVEIETVVGHGSERKITNETRVTLTTADRLDAINRAIDLLYVLRADLVDGTTNTDRTPA